MRDDVLSEADGVITVGHGSQEKDTGKDVGNADSHRPRLVGGQRNIDLGQGDDVGHVDVDVKDLEAPEHLLIIPKLSCVLNSKLKKVGAPTFLGHVTPVSHETVEGQVLFKEVFGDKVLKVVAQVLRCLSKEGLELGKMLFGQPGGELMP